MEEYKPLTEEQLNEARQSLYKTGFQHGAKSASNAMFYLTVIGIMMFLLMTYFVYQYNREHKRVQELEAGIVKDDAATKEKLQEFRDNINDTLDNYYMVNKNDLSLITKMQIDTSEMSQIYVEINPK